MKKIGQRQEENQTENTNIVDLVRKDNRLATYIKQNGLIIPIWNWTQTQMCMCVFMYMHTYIHTYVQVNDVDNDYNNDEKTIIITTTSL